MLKEVEGLNSEQYFVLEAVDRIERLNEGLAMTSSCIYSNTLRSSITHGDPFRGIDLARAFP